jgi:hypothetical protein
MRDWILSVNGERLFLQGANLGPTRMALAEATPPSWRPTSSWPPRPGSTCCGPRPRGPARAYDAADEPGCSLAGLPAAVGLRPVHPQARPSARRARWWTCWPTTRRSRSGAATTSRWPRHRPRREADRPRARRLACRGASPSELPTWNKTVLDRTVKRTIERGRRLPAGDRPLRACSPTCPSSTAPTATSTSAGTGATSATWPGFARACPARCASPPSSAPRPCPTPPTSSTPSGGPTSTGTAWAARHNLHGSPARPVRAARRPRHLRLVEGRDPGATRPGRAPPRRDAAAAQVPAHRGLRCQFAFADGHPVRSPGAARCSTTSRAQGGARRGPRRARAAPVIVVAVGATVACGHPTRRSACTSSWARTSWRRRRGRRASSTTTS